MKPAIAPSLEPLCAFSIDVMQINDDVGQLA